MTKTIALVLLVLLAPSADAQTRKARKALAQLKTVDGAGSGLDADTVQGQTPANIAAAGAALAAAAFSATLPQAVYRRTQSLLLPSDICNCVETGCAAAGDLLLNCGGSIIPFNGGYLSQVATLNSGACEICGCTTGVLGTLTAQATCLKLVP